MSQKTPEVTDMDADRKVERIKAQTKAELGKQSNFTFYRLLTQFMMIKNLRNVRLNTRGNVSHSLRRSVG